MKNIACVTVLSILAFCLYAAELKPYHESLTPRRLSEWKDSSDGKISICFVVDRTTFTSGETITLRGALRNNSDKPLTILRPFGDPFYAYSSGLSILGPDGIILYRGPMKDYVLGTSSFLELGAHTVIEQALELPHNIFPGLGKPGLYMIGYVFASGGYPRQPPPENFWQGQIEAASVTLLVK